MTTTPFVDAMRQETMRLHSVAQKRGEFTTPNPSFPGYVRWIQHQRQIHHALKRFEVQPKVDLVEALDTELYFLELHATWCDTLLPATPSSAYAAYLDSLDDARLGCHFYNVACAHLSGGNIYVATSAKSAVPNGWIETSDFFNVANTEPSREMATNLKEAFETYCQTEWTSQQRETCLEETPRAFAYGTLLHDVLNENEDTLPYME